MADQCSGHICHGFVPLWVVAHTGQSTSSAAEGRERYHFSRQSSLQYRVPPVIRANSFPQFLQIRVGAMHELPPQYIPHRRASRIQPTGRPQIGSSGRSFGWGSSNSDNLRNYRAWV
jgi:hypothetical protein